MNYITTGSELTSIANAIREKGGTTEPLTYPSEFVSAIEAIPTGGGGGGGGSADDDVRFIDYDGTIVYSYSAADFLALNAMPENPTHERLTAQGWNWSLADAKEYVEDYGMLDIGQMYITTSGATEIDIELPEGWLSPYLSIGLNGTAIIDWGDGSQVDTITGSSLNTRVDANHTYQTSGLYTITITISGSAAIFGSSNRGGSYLLWGYVTASSDPSNSAPYRNAIKRVRLGANISLGSNTQTGTIGGCCFDNCRNLESITIPYNISVNTYIDRFCKGCYSLTTIILPPTFVSIPEYAFNSCYSLSNMALPFTLTQIGSASIITTGISRLCIPPLVTSLGATWLNQNYSLKTIIFPFNIGTIWYAPNNPTLKNVIISPNISANSIASFCSPNTCIEVFNVPASITSISSSFTECWALRELRFLGNNCTTIQSNCFTNCYSLIDLVFPDSLETIGANTFTGLHSLPKLVLPKNLQSIESGAFRYCYGVVIVDLTALDAVPTLGANTCFNGGPPGMKFYVKASLLSQFQSATNWSVYASQMVGV